MMSMLEIRFCFLHLVASRQALLHSLVVSWYFLCNVIVQDTFLLSALGGIPPGTAAQPLVVSDV
jgi:hypothetical protein